MKRCAIALLLATGIGASGAASAQSSQWTDWMKGWRYGLGTGLFGLNMTGQYGFFTQFGSPVFDGTLKSSQIRDYADSAYGFTAFASKDKWSVLWRYSHLKLENSLSGVVRTGATLTANFGFKADVGELDGVYQLGGFDQHQFGGLLGVRYTHQEFDVNVVGPMRENSRGVSTFWYTGIIGLTHQVPASPTVTWHNRIDVGAGGNNWAYHANTGFRWAFYKNWAADFYGDFLKTDYQKSSKGVPGFYLYRVKEFGVGAAISYTF
jgi:hypothetical protein